MKKLYFILFFTSILTAQNESGLLFVNQESNVGYGGTVSTTNIAKDSNGNTYLLGNFINLVDFDPSVAENTLTSINTERGDMFIAKYDAVGNYLWAKNIGGTGKITPTGLCIGGNSIFVTGNFTYTVDFDPSDNVAVLTTASINEGALFLAKYDLNGQYSACQSIDGNGEIIAEDLKFLNNELFVAGAISGTIDLDPASGVFQITSNGFKDAYVAKYTSSLSFQTAFSFGNIGEDIATSLAFDANGNILVSGSFNRTVDFDPSSSTTNLNTNPATTLNTFIAKYSNNGNFQWAKNIGGRTAIGSSSMAKLALDSADNIVVTGSYNMSSDFDPSSATANLQANGYEIFLAKYDASGNYIFVKRIGSTGNDYSRNIALDASNNIYIRGTFVGTVNFNPNSLAFNLDSTNGNAFFAKYNSDGTFSTAANLKANITAIMVNNADEFMVTGDFIETADFDPSAGTANLSSLQTNSFIAKYATNGSYLFAKPIGGNKPINSVMNFIASDASGNIFRAGTLSALTDLDPSSGIFNVSSTSSMGIFIAKHNSNGGLIWAKTISGGSVLSVTTMNTDSNGNTYVIGKFKGTIDFDPSGNVANLTSNATSNDLYIAKYDSSGNYIWANQISGSVYARTNIEFDSLGNIYFSGGLTGTSDIDLDPSPSATYFFRPTGQVLPFMIKLDPSGNLIKVVALYGAAPTDNWAEICKLVLKDNYLYIVGRFMGTVNFNPTLTINSLSTGIPLTNETFVAKYDLNFDFQLAFNFNNADSDTINKGSSIVVDNNDIYVTTYVIGSTGVDFDPSAENSNIISTTASQQAVVVSKYDQNGIFQWAKKMDGLSPTNTMMDMTLPLPFNLLYLSFSMVKDNNIIIAFTTWSPINFDPTASNFTITPATDSNIENNFLRQTIVFAKYNKLTGDFVWADKINGAHSGQLHYATQDNNQNMLISGMFNGTADFDFSAAVQNKVSASPFDSDRFWAKYEINTLGIIDHDTNNTDFVIYPNPASTELYVNHKVYNEFSVTLLDITGKILHKSVLNNLKGLDVSMYPKGMYFLKIESQNEKKHYKFIKE